MRPCIGHSKAVVLMIGFTMSCRNHEPKPQPTPFPQPISVSVNAPVGSIDRSMNGGIARDPSYPFRNAPPSENAWTNQGIGYPAVGPAKRPNPWNQDLTDNDPGRVTVNFRSGPEQDLHSSVKSWQDSIEDFTKSMPADFVEDPRPVLDESALQIP